MDTTTIKIRMERSGTNDVATVEISGSELWMNALIPGISQFAGAAANAFAIDAENRELLGGELGQALEAVMNGLNYYGTVVTVTRGSSDPAVQCGQ